MPFIARTILPINISRPTTTRTTISSSSRSFVEQQQQQQQQPEQQHQEQQKGSGISNKLQCNDISGSCSATIVSDNIIQKQKSYSTKTNKDQCNLNKNNARGRDEFLSGQKNFDKQQNEISCKSVTTIKDYIIINSSNSRINEETNSSTSSTINGIKNNSKNSNVNKLNNNDHPQQNNDGDDDVDDDVDDFGNNVDDVDDGSELHHQLNGDVDDNNKKNQYSSRINNKTTLVSSNYLKNKNNNLINGREFENISNLTLSNTLRQLASVVVVANDIFFELNIELQNISDRTRVIKQKIKKLDENVNEFNPREVEVPESNFETFLQIKNHFTTKLVCDKELFKKETRPKNVQMLYEAAGKTPGTDSVDYVDTSSRSTTIHHLDETNSLFSFNDFFETKKLKINAEIEIRLPERIKELRKWTSVEALGEVTVSPDCINKVGSFIEGDITNILPSNLPSTYTKFSDLPGDNDIAIDHILPSPEEQCQMIAEKYPAEVVTVDISGRRFDRMCLSRKSIYGQAIQNDYTPRENSNERKTKTKKGRSKRRNTIIGIDTKEITEALEGETVSPNELSIASDLKSEKSKSSDLLRKETESSGKITSLSRFNSLKNWSKNRLKFSSLGATAGDHYHNDEKKKSNQNVFEEANDIDEFKSVTIKNKKKYLTDRHNNKQHNNNANNDANNKNINFNDLTVNYFQSGSTSSNSPESCIGGPAVKLRESSSLRRQRRNDSVNYKDEPHSSSGNWSASSECSEITILPKSSASSMSLNHNNSYQSFTTGSNGPPSSIISRRRFLNTSASSSVTSEGAPSTPDHMMNEISFIDDETSSAYSCDTEGYYTSFHIDSGLKTLREEEPPVTPLHSTSALSSNNSIGTILNQTSENEYELFGRGSTSTTASSNNTVCTTLLTGNENDFNSLNDIPENKLSYSTSSTCSSSTATLERSGTIKRNSKALHKESVEGDVQLEKNKAEQKERERMQTPNVSEQEISEFSDVESVDRSERIRQKTAISSSRIPSMCIITPTTSDDDEISKGQYSTIRETNNNNFNRIHKSIVESSDINNLNISDTDLYSSIGEYVTLQETPNNKNNIDNINKVTEYSLPTTNIPLTSNESRPSYGNLLLSQDIEYVSLNELPPSMKTKSTSVIFKFGHMDSENDNNDKKININNNKTSSGMKKKPDMRVEFDAHGKIIFNSDTLKRRKAGHSTFLPGPHVKDNADSALTSCSSVNKNELLLKNSNLKLLTSGGCINRNIKAIRPIYGRIEKKKMYSETVGNVIAEIKHEINKDFTDSTNTSNILNTKEVEESERNKEFQKALRNQNEPFKRNAQIYGTLPKKYSSAQPSSKRMLMVDHQQHTNMKTMSPNNVSFNQGTFKTSTPSKLNELTDCEKSLQRLKITTTNDEVPKVCSDRLGTAKTSLMDFKKLLLAKSTKNVGTLNSKLSAVEMLKVSKQQHPHPQTPLIPNVVKPNLNSSMILLELSRSPKSFANRRMIRQGQFGSPSKLIMSNVKKRNVSYNLNSTDVISSTIHESIKEDDSTSSSGSVNSQNSASTTKKSVSDEHINFKNNFFLQAEENNFMKSERHSPIMPIKQDIAPTTTKLRKHDDHVKLSSALSLSTASEKKAILPSFETSL